MNAYRVLFNSREFEVLATNGRTAINRALQGFERREDIFVSCRLHTRNVARPRTEKQSHGTVRELTA